MNVEALRALEKAVEAGEFPADVSARDLGLDKEYGGLPVIRTMYRAFNNSTDAALSLLASVLPEWKLHQLHQFPAGHWLAGIYQFKEDWPKWVEWPSHSARADSAARAILLAIIRALIAQAEAKGVE
jgi:hypothetical protein